MRFARGRLALEERGEVLPVEQLHRDVAEPVARSPVEVLHRVRVADARGRARHAFEPLHEARIGGEVPAHDLERDLSRRFVALGDVDARHPAFAELTFDEEAARHAGAQEIRRHRGRVSQKKDARSPLAQTRPDS